MQDTEPRMLTITVVGLLDGRNPMTIPAMAGRRTASMYIDEMKPSSMPATILRPE